MNNSGSHLSKEMLDLIKAIGDSRSKQEEDKIIVKESEVLKTKIKESGVNNKKMKEYLLRAIYIEMLGHDAHFAQKYTLNLTQDKNILNKRVGYLACNLLLSESSEFLILLVASLQKDIQSNNWVEICMALTSVVKFANSIIMSAVTEPILKLLENKNEQVRKKSVMCLFKFYQVNANFIPDVDDRMRKLLCDFDPSVMAATLNYFAEVVKKNPEKYKDLVSPLIVILKQVIEHKLPREFDYHRFPAPWIQVKLLEILANIGRDDQFASENMYEILSQTLRRADDTGINIGYAIVYQCLRTICIIYPNQHLIELASTTISRFLSSDSPNLRCTGINGLGLIIQINPAYVMNHQQVIVDCLEENDETLKKNTFDLLYKMTTMENAEIIVDKMMKYLKFSTLELHGRKDILYKITELSERFAPDKGWFIKIMNQLFVNFGELITDEILSKLIKLINEWESETDEDEFKQFTVENYQAIIDNYSYLPDSLVKLMAWVIGEYGKKLYRNEEDKLISILQMLEYLLSKSYDDEMTKCMLITAITKVHSNINFLPLEFVTNIIEKYSRDKNVEIQQRCLEYKRLLNSNTSVFKNQFTTIIDELDIDSNLSFLNSFVKSKISQGCKKYDRNKYEAEKNLFERDEKGELNFGPYSSPDNITSNPNKMSDALTKLYNTKDTTLRTNPLSNDLKVGEVKWSAGGYKETKKPVNSTPVPLQTNNISSVSSSGGATVNIIQNSSGNNRFEAIQGPKIDKNEKKDEPKNLFSGIKKKEEQVWDKNREEKEKMKGIFGGLAKSTNSTTPNSVSTTNNQPVFQQKPSTKISSQSNSNKNTATADLIGLGTVTTANNQGNNPNKQQNTANTFNLLDEIFSSGSSSSQQQPTNLISNNNVKPVNLLDMNNLGNIPVSNNNASTTKTNSGMFDMLKSNTTSSINRTSISLKDNFTPFNTDTDTFGELWTSCSSDEISYEITTKTLRTPDSFFKVISSEANFNPVQIIGTEAIASAKYKNKITLVHTTVNGDTSLSMLIKCYDQNLASEVGNFLQGLLSNK
jgi:AP-4 complex subunit epsilon-1